MANDTELSVPDGGLKVTRLVRTLLAVDRSTIVRRRFPLAQREVAWLLRQGFTKAEISDLETISIQEDAANASGTGLAGSGASIKR